MKIGKFFLGVLLIGTLLHGILLPKIFIKPDKLAYLHYNFIKVSVKGSPDFLKDTVACVYKNGEKVTTVGAQDCIKFKYNHESKLWEGKFPVPWGAEDGIYTIRLLQDNKLIDWEQVFYIKTRIPHVKFNSPLKILDLESMKRLKSFKVKNPSGERVGYTGIFDWIKYIGGNTLWYIAGQTASYKKNDLQEDRPWVKDNLKTLKEFAEKAKSENINFGAWISCFRVFGKSSLKPDWYNYSYKLSKGKVVETNGISILDHKRVDDIIKLAKTLNDMESVDYIGLDYIRPAGGGLDLVDEFVEAMAVEVPDSWNEFSKTRRMEWLGRIVTRSSNRNVPLIDKWNWWRAQRISKIINLLKEKGNLKKPLWTFVLSWEMGHQHGQDPIMFQDAGIDLIAVMIYETDGPRFDHIISEWKEYLKDFNVNIVIGNQLDWILHQYSVYPSGPAEYARRMEKSIEYIDETGNLRGLFIHDFARAMRGRLGPYTSMEWLIGGARGFTKLSKKENRIKINIDIPDVIKTDEIIKASLKLENLTDNSLNNININFPRLSGIEILNNVKLINVLNVKETKEIPFNIRVRGKPCYRMGRYMVGVRAVHEEGVYIDFKNFWVKGVSLDNGSSYR